MMKTNREADARAENLASETKVYEEKLVIPVIEEEAVFDKRVVETGKVRISKRISEHEELIDEPLFRQEVFVKRVPVNH